jgi:ADP-heptose:LPS heptosyltransferase
MSEEKILVIRHGALGDIFLCMKPFQDIRAAFPEAHITLLTMPPFAPLARRMPWFNEVIEDHRVPLLMFWENIGLALRLKRENFTFVFDFQNKPRTAFYYKFLGKNVKWSGSARGCSHPRPAMEGQMHHQEKILRQIRAAGVMDSGPLKLDWLWAPIEEFRLPTNYAVLIPGCAPHRLYKRWPPEHYAALARALMDRGRIPVLVGAESDSDAVNSVIRQADCCINLCGKTTLPQLASLFRGAKLTIGNDTGPTHLSALLGTPTLSLISGEVDPVQSGPIGPRCAYVQRQRLDDLEVREVEDALKRLLI